jgi:hypothetical protein
MYLECSRLVAGSFDVVNWDLLRYIQNYLHFFSNIKPVKLLMAIIYKHGTTNRIFLQKTYTSNKSKTHHVYKVAQRSHNKGEISCARCSKKRKFGTKTGVHDMNGSCYT